MTTALVQKMAEEVTQNSSSPLKNYSGFGRKAKLNSSKVKKVHKEYITTHLETNKINANMS